MSRRPLAALLLAALALPGVARADRQAQCIEAFERAQRTRKSGELIAARKQFRACAEPSCPSMVRKDCTDALAELGKAIPSVRPKLEDAQGNALSGYTLAIDGAQIEVGAEPLELDPGKHVLVFQHGGRSVETSVTLRSGDVAVPVIAELGEPKTAGAPAETRKPSTPTLAYVLGGVAVLGVAGFVGFGLAGRSTESCKGSCSEDEIDTVHRQYLLADVSLGVAVVSGGLASWLFLSKREPAERAASRRWVGVAPSRAGALVAGGVRF